MSGLTQIQGGVTFTGACEMIDYSKPDGFINMATMNYPRMYASCANINNAYIYTFGGSFKKEDNSGHVGVCPYIEAYDIQNNKWSVVNYQNQNYAPMICMMACSVGNMVYLFGGCKGEDEVLENFEKTKRC